MKHKRSIQWLYSQLPELITNDVINEQTADKICDYYDNQDHTQTNLVIVLFSILGAALIGTGIISILAHNWDTLPRVMKLSLAFTPLLAAQALTIFSLKYKPQSKAWSEGSGTFLTFSIAAAIALVGQIYHVPGNLADFTCAWMFLTIPVIFLLNSTATLIIYSGQMFLWSTAMLDDHRNPLLYFALLLPIVIFFINLLKKEGPAARTRLIGWALAITFAITFGFTLCYWGIEEELILVYALLGGIYYLIGNWNSYQSTKPFTLYSFNLIGLWGMTTLSIIGSFADFWDHALDSISLPIQIITALLSVAIFSTAYVRKQNDALIQLALPIIFTASAIGLTTEVITPFIPALMLNIYLLVHGLAAITAGIRLNKLGTINFGMGLLSTVIVLRFFDSDLSFIARGIIFILIGIGFLSTNIFIVKRRKTLNKTKEVQA